MEGNGNCYESASKIILEVNSDDILLCHGTAIGQGPIEGIEHGHAWVEINGMVLDYSNGQKVIIPKDKYYDIGKIKNVVKYTRKDVIKNLCKFKTYGPWSKVWKRLNLN